MANMSAKILSDSTGVINDSQNKFSREEYQLNPNNRIKPHSALMTAYRHMRSGRSVVSENPGRSIALAAFVGLLAGGLLFAMSRRSSRTE